VAEALAALLTGDGGAFDLTDEVRRVETFDERGLLTRDAGFVLTLADRSEYQVTVVCSRPAEGGAR
jgi:hypothetical protein